MSDLTARLSVALAGRYAIQQRIGAGGMATVYLARDIRHGRMVAVKVLRPELASAIGPERFLQEIKATANLNHPHILPLHDSGEADGFLYFVTPYITGGSLRDHLDEERRLPVAEALRLTRDVADALAYAHREGLVHRDIKPGNVLLNGHHALVADFGIARAVSAAPPEWRTATGIVLGTPAYMSPEHAAGDQDLDGRSDLFSLGCMLFEMLTGAVPFTGNSQLAVITKRLSTTAPDVATLRSDVPPAVSLMVRQLLRREPPERFQTGEEVVDACEAAAMTDRGMGGADVSAHGGAISSKPAITHGRSASRVWVLVFGVVTTAALVLLTSTSVLNYGAPPVLVDDTAGSDPNDVPTTNSGDAGAAEAGRGDRAGAQETRAPAGPLRSTAGGAPAAGAHPVQDRPRALREIEAAIGTVLNALERRDAGALRAARDVLYAEAIPELEEFMRRDYQRLEWSIPASGRVIHSSSDGATFQVTIRFIQAAGAGSGPPQVFLAVVDRVTGPWRVRALYPPTAGGSDRQDRIDVSARPA